ncbi:MAG: carboxypeptidase-like regulatory domain-containing protein [bacterium]
MKRKLFIILIAVLLFPSLIYAGITGKIRGQVVDRETGDALPGANIVVVGTTMGAASDINGEYIILNVPVGTYSVRASFIGYRDVTMENIRVNSDLTTEVNFEMPSEALEVSEISIVAERPLVQKNATNAVRIQGYEEIKNLPVRGVGAAIALQPGIVVQNDNLYIRGGRVDEVGYYLEGANVRDVDDGEVDVVVIPEALEEYQIQAGGYTAEFGGANAGIIRATLKSGTPDYHFTFQAETDDFAGQGEKFLDTFSYGYRDLTATVGGPIPGTNNKLKFFLAGQRILESDRIVRFLKGFNFQHSETVDIAHNRFPLIMEPGTTTDAELEALIQQQGLVMNDGNVPNSARQQWIGNGTLTWDLKPFIFRLGGSFSWRKQDEVITNFPAMIFNDRVEQEELSTGVLNLKITHLLTSRSFYEVNLNIFDRREVQYDPLLRDNFWGYWDSTANAAEGVQFYSLNGPWRGVTEPMEIYGFDFIPPGSPAASDYIKSKRSYIGASFAFTTQLEQHEVKFGGRYERWTARFFNVQERTQLIGARNNPDLYRRALAGDPVAVAEFRVLAGHAMRMTYGYDPFGNEIDVEGPNGPRHPKYFSFYAQDKFEASDLVINAGLRVDVFDNDDIEFNLENPPWDRDLRGLDLDVVKKHKADVEVSPRIGLAFPVTDRTVFHLQYGRFVQAPRLTDLYNGQSWYDAIFIGGTSFQGGNVGAGLEPEKTTQYEIGFSQQFTDNAAFDVTAFYKNIRDQLQLLRVVVDPASPATDYNMLTNGDFSTTSGVELSMTLRRTARVAAQLNYTFSRSLGTGSIPADAISGIELGRETPTVISPLDFHRPHIGSINFDYRFGRGDGGPILQQLGLNLLLTFSSGHPYTLTEGDFGQQDESFGGQITDPRSRRPLENVNGSLTPWNWTINLRLDKTIDFGRFDANFYIYVQNLTNRRNVVNVYRRTGNPWDDGFMGIPEAPSIIAAHGGDPYLALYQAINLSGNGINFRRDDGVERTGLELFGEPRQIRVGARFEF